MRPKLLSILIASLFLPAVVQAQEAEKEKAWSGSVSLGARHTDTNATDPSKLNEYRDLNGTNAVFGFDVRHRGGLNYFNAYGENVGLDDQYIDLNGGRYGAYKYRLFDNELRHNFGSGAGARSPFNGIGSNTLTATLPSLNVNNWNTFNHSYTRKDMGGTFELQAASPWYFRVDGNQVKREGVNVFAGAKGTSPGNGFMDLPAPIDYTTQNISGEIGWSSKRAHVALNLMHSKFDNGNTVLRWNNDFYNPGLTLLDTTVLPPSNEYSRLSLNGNVRQLPMDSTFAARFTFSTLTNDVAMQPTMLSTGSTQPATSPSDPTFHGDQKRTTVGLSLASHPNQNVDTKLYYNYDKLKNDSTEMSFRPPTGSGLTAGSTNPIVNCANVAVTPGQALCTAELFHYTKQNLGAEAGYRIDRQNRLLGTLDYAHTDRERADFPKTKETRLSGEYKTAAIESMTWRLKYQYLQRRSDFEADASTLAANPIDLYVRRFDLSDVNQNLIKFVADMTPAQFVDVGLEVILKRNRYQNVQVGRTDDQRQEYYGSVGWGDPASFRVLAFGDLEYVTYDSNHRADQANNGNPDPATPPAFTTPCSGANVCAYNWRAHNKDTSWQVGLGADWVPEARWKVKASMIYAETNGRADFMVQQGGATFNTTSGLPFNSITNFDNTRRISFTVRGIYEMTKQTELTGAYSYEKYNYSDIGYDNTRYVGGAGTSAFYTTGQFAFQPYKANIFYVVAKYKF